MLVLSRRANEKIVFPSINTVVHVVSLKSGAVRLGIEAPHEVPIFREELLPLQGNQPPKADPPTIVTNQ